MVLFEIPEMANLIRRECEDVGKIPPGVSAEEFEMTMCGFNRRYLEEMMVLVGLVESA